MKNARGQAGVAWFTGVSSGGSVWFTRHREYDLDVAQMAAWVKQAAALPGWVP